ncbi:phosphatidylinositol 4-phosphate 5-kinase-like protein 1 isoform X1 [Tachysurus ichikawai]
MAGPSSGSTRMMKRKGWGGLRQRWKLLGVFEIDPQHEFYLLTCMMKEGLAAAVQNTIDNPIPCAVLFWVLTVPGPLRKMKRTSQFC